MSVGVALSGTVVLVGPWAMGAASVPDGWYIPPVLAVGIMGDNVRFSG